MAVIDMTTTPPRVIKPNDLFAEVMTWDLFQGKPDAGAYATWLLTSASGIPWKAMQAIWEAADVEPPVTRHIDLTLPGDPTVRHPGVWRIDGTRALGVVYGPGELDVTYVIAFWPADTFSKWEVRSLDVWGNPNDGWDVNASYKAGEIVLEDDAPDKAIIGQLTLEYIVPEHALEFEIDDADGDFFAIVHKATGRPLLHLFKIGPVEASDEDET